MVSGPSVPGTSVHAEPNAAVLWRRTRGAAVQVMVRLLLATVRATAPRSATLLKNRGSNVCEGEVSVKVRLFPASQVPPFSTNLNWAALPGASVALLNVPVKTYGLAG